MSMHSPPHSGEVLRELFFKPLGIAVADTARSLGVSRKMHSAILHRGTGPGPEMAIRLAKAFDTTAESWLSQQMQYGLWVNSQTLGELDVEKLSDA